MVIDEHDDEPEGLGALVVELGTVCSGYEMGTVVTALLYLLADCAAQSDVPKHEFLAQAYESLDNLYDDMENDNGSSTYN
jgi:hypothetical protein